MARLLQFSAFILLAIAAISCGTKQTSEAPQDPLNNEALEPFSANAVYPQGWNELIVDANQAKTVIDAQAHWSTNHNCANRPTFGAMSMEDWNRIASNINKALNAAPGSDPYCTELQGSSTCNLYGGTATLTLPNNQKKAIFEYKDGKVCTTIADHALADELRAAINTLILQADNDDCPFPGRRCPLPGSPEAANLN